MFSCLLHGINFFLRRFIVGIIENPVHRHAPVDIDRRLFTDDGAVHIKGGDPVFRLKIVRAFFIRAVSHKSNKLFK